MVNEIYELQKNFRDLNIEFIFSGAFSQGLIEELGQTIKQRLLFLRIEKSKISSLFFAFIEQTQNIKQYIVSKKNTEHYKVITGSGVIAVLKNDTGYSVDSSNIISNDDIPILKEKLDKVIMMKKDELENYFRKESKKKIDMQNDKAGLGLIQVARKANRIGYRFENIDDIYSYYILTVKI